ncbi:MAG TPA: alpha/beta hydrolase [Caulobacteraceae bacterium]|jgi:predicted esterase|nr:alpha/beta hydrolase [Caulobacteraceae bacterium]
MRHSRLDFPSASFGAEERQALLAAVLLHGRHESPAHMVEIARRLGAPGVRYLALQAQGSQWYPRSFLAPLEANQPALDWALERVEQEVQGLEARGWPRRRIALIGYSQGACLACEYVYRHPTRWAGLLAFTGGLIGPPGTEWPAPGDLARTPVLLSNGDADPWVPWPRVETTARRFEAANAEVDLRLYPGRAHEVCDDEIAVGRAILDRALDRAKAGD